MSQFLASFLLLGCFSSALFGSIQVDSSYASIIEKILFYKRGSFAAYYGGPIERAAGGVRWIMPCTFENDSYRTRAVYEIAFIHCDPTSCEGAEVLFVQVSDINIKFKNILSQDYKIFSNLLNGQYSQDKYVVVRSADVANVFFPNHYIHSQYGYHRESDKDVIIDFLSKEFKTKNSIHNHYHSEFKDEIDFETDEFISYKPVMLDIDLQGKIGGFRLVKKIIKTDPWKVYYLISKNNLDLKAQEIIEDTPLIRIDSGCVSGQIYDDSSCDCIDQLHTGLYQISQEPKSLIIHIPTHDGRGYGMAPKAETEIYKRGGRGRVHQTQPLDTVASAHLLYTDGIYDIRSYDGAAMILKDMQFKEVSLLTDNILKVSSLKKYDIKVTRKKTDTQKDACLHHLQAKQNSENYYSD